MTSPADPPVDRRPLEETFRAVLGHFATGVTVVTTVADGIDHAMTASAFCSVSMDPPLILVCVDRRNRIHEALNTSKAWGVSMLSQGSQDAATWLAKRGRPLDGQLDAVPHGHGEATGAALIDDAIAWLECRTWDAYDGGDHTILVGEVIAARVRDGLDDPLLYYRSHYGSLVRSAASEKNSGSIGPPPVGPA